MEKKKTLGSNPLEAYLTSSKESTSCSKDVSSDALDAKKKERITIHLPVELIDAIKNVVYWEPGLTLTAFAEEAFEKALQQKVQERGEPYPERKERTLKSGRPVV